MDNQKCKLCFSNQYEVVYEGDTAADPKDKKYTITDLETKPSFTIAKCRRCGLIYALGHMDGGAITSFYEEMSDDLYVKEEQGRRHSAKVLLKKIQKFKKRGKLLDIGCATGFLLDEAKKIGFDVQGLEMSSWAVNLAREKYNLSVQQGTVFTADFPYNYFDVIVMTDVIEHLPDPLGVLVKIRQILKPDGMLCVTTPDIDSFISRFLKARWWGIKNSHLVYFSRNTMEKMLDRAGFNMVRSGAHPRAFSIHYWFSRLSFYSGFWRTISELFLKTFKKELLITLNLYDQLEFFIRKKRALEFLDQDEKTSRPQRAGILKTTAVIPAYNASKTLLRTVNDIPKGVVSDIILVDDGSTDDTPKIAQSLSLKIFYHESSKGYGATQKTCYREALKSGADIIVMLHGDYQYDPKDIPELIKPIAEGRVDAVFGSRMMKGGSLEGGMPLWKHNANILSAALENIIFKTYLTEYHSGFRAYSAKLLKTIQFERNSDGFVFDTEIIAQALLHNFKIEEIPIKTRYFAEASTLRFWQCVGYSFGVIKALFKFILHDNNMWRFRQFE